ncbi:hypothetical protein ACIQNU_30490 [Streptomyces sp. NPDC091292]|uniref:hypothetical protein n=1 Tax=Streptomyces sp. NPDC091292 TaxID=3365991 RepID=UPI00381C59C2
MSREGAGPVVRVEEGTADVAGDEDVTAADVSAAEVTKVDVTKADVTKDVAYGDGDAEAGEAGAAPDSVGEDDGEDGRPPERSGERRWLIGLATGAVLLALTGGLLLHQAHQLRNTPAAANHALTDVEATTRVNGDVSNALAKVFSYTPGGTAATERSARELLSGRAARQYTELFAQVRENVSEQRVTLTTQAVRVGTVSLDGNSAHLLVFLDQTAHRGDKKPTTSAAQLSVTAQLRDGVWQIVDIKAR